jgi:ATPase subunit of ABC transporter with duplicated ATPase domains
MISVSNLGMGYGPRTLFSGASFQLNPGERYGLVGANGSGKSTLLRILAGELEPTDGTVSVPKRLRLGVLGQERFLDDEESIVGAALMGNRELWEAMKEKEALLAGGEEGFDAHRFSELEEIVQLHDGYTAEARAATILEGLGIASEVHRRPLRTLSGGFKLRVLLARVLAANPDVLLLDEPTNHLDILSIRWLETFLGQFPGPAVVISHDHRFLDNVATHILDVDYETVTLYSGDYSAFVGAKAAERERREKEIQAREREIAHHQKFVDRFRAKASKARQAQSKLRLIERKSEDLDELPASSRRYPTFRFQPRRASGRDVLTLKGIRKSFGSHEVLHGVDLVVGRGDRLAILGPNGIGKSTLLKIAVGELDADAGEVAWGYEAHPGYFAQDHPDRLESHGGTAQDWLWAACPERDMGFVRGQLGLVLLGGDEASKPLSALSGGEAARLVFARLAVERPNVLVLDEPTNHLDLEAIEMLVEGLKTFDGTLVLVSHDRWFVSELATRVVEIRPDGVVDYRGSYEEYVHHCADDHLDADRVILKARREKRAPADRGRPAAEARSGRAPEARDGSRKRRLEERRETLTGRIDGAEARIREIDALFCEPDYFERTPAEEVRGLEAERARLERRVEALMREWEEAEAALEALSR